MIKIYLLLAFVSGSLAITSSVQAQAAEPVKFIVEHDAQVVKEQPGPHDGGGKTMGYSFFDGVKDYKTAFKKRTLLPGSSIGYHP